MPAAVLTVEPQATANADSCSDAATNMPLAMNSGACADVLAQERRWLTAITDGPDDNTVGSSIDLVIGDFDGNGIDEIALFTTDKVTFYQP